MNSFYYVFILGPILKWFKETLLFSLKLLFFLHHHVVYNLWWWLHIFCDSYFSCFGVLLQTCSHITALAWHASLQGCCVTVQRRLWQGGAQPNSYHVCLRLENVKAFSYLYKYIYRERCQLLILKRKKICHHLNTATLRLFSCSRCWVTAACSSAFSKALITAAVVFAHCMKKTDINIYLLLFTPGPCWLQSCSLMPFCIIYIILVCVSTSTTLCGSGACCFLFFPPSSVCYSSSLLNECVQQHSSVVKPQSERTVTKTPHLVF